MNEKEFEGLISSEILLRERKLEAFEGFIKQLLQDCPFLSAAQINDRWIDNVKMFDKDIQKEVDEYRHIRAEHPAPVLYHVDPCEGDIWEMEYSAWRNGID